MSQPPRDRPQRRHDRGKAGPGANGLTAALFVEGGTDNREAARDEERCPNSLSGFLREAVE